MANERRVRQGFLSGLIDDNPLSNSATTLNSTELAGLEAIDSTEHAVLVLDPTGAGNGPEVVYVTAHTGSATSATIARGREGTSGVQHASVITWVHVATVHDYNQTLTTAPSGTGLPYEGQLWTDVTNDRLMIGDVSNVSQQIGHYSSTGRRGGSWSRATTLSIGSGSDGTQVTWTTEGADSDAYLTPTSGTITIPAGLGGLYGYRFSATWASGPSSPGLLVDVGGTRRIATALAYSSTITSGDSGFLVLAAADTVSFKLLHQTGSNININPASLDFYRLAI
jgi:hypothetical protein